MDDLELIKQAAEILEELEKRKLIDKVNIRDSENRIITSIYSMLPAQTLFNQIKKKKAKEKFDKYLDKFEIYYVHYPEKANTKGEKEKTEKHWINLMKRGIDPDRILQGLQNYKQFLSKKEKDYRVYLITNFLYKQIFEQFIGFKTNSGEVKKATYYNEL